jgi:hypothetical protein
MTAFFGEARANDIIILMRLTAFHPKFRQSRPLGGTSSPESFDRAHE